MDIAARVGQTVIRSLTLQNSGSGSLGIQISGGGSTSGVWPRSLTVAAGATQPLRLAVACDAAGSRTLRYTLATNDPARPTATLDLNVGCTDATGAHAAPITITRGGTYSGSWESTDPAVAAVSIRTAEPVVIENCRVRGPGNLIASRFSDADAFPGVDVTIRNCSGIGTHGVDTPRGRGHFYVGVWPKRVVIENNHYASTSGVWLIGNSVRGDATALRVTGNRVRNVTGGHNAIGVVEFAGTPGVEIAWNEVINEPFAGHQEDVILTYKLQSSAADPARVHSNFIDGAYPRDPRTNSSTGSGINAGDGGDNTAGNEHVRAERNHVVRAVNVGMFIAAGSNNLLAENRILRSGLLPDGSRINHRFTGMYVWDCCYGQVPSGVFRDNVARDNLVGYESVDASGNVTRHADKLDHCATDAGGATRCTGNTAPNGRVTPAMEDAERGRWLDRVAERGEPLGPR